MAGGWSSELVISDSMLIHRVTKRTGIGDLLGSWCCRALVGSEPSVLSVGGARRGATGGHSGLAVLTSFGRNHLTAAGQRRRCTGLSPTVARIRLSCQYRAAPTLCRRADRVAVALGYRDRVFAWA